MKPIDEFLRPSSVIEFPIDRFPADRHGLIRREATVRVGIADDVVNAAVRRGRLLRLAPGVWVPAFPGLEDADGVDRLYRYRSIAVATSARDRGVSTPSHFSAAALLGLDTLHPDRERVHLTKSTARGGFVRGLRHVHNGPLTPAETVEIDGVVVTRLERTAVDIAMAGSFEQAIVVLDAALRLGADPAVMTAMVDARAGTPNIGVARRALSLADARSESVGESWSRAQMIEAGIPLPRLQHTFETSYGDIRSDFDWEGLVIGEFDGMHKYDNLIRDGETVRDVLIREKRREGALAEQGIVVIRWTWSTLERRELAQILRPSLARIGLVAA